MFTHWTRPNNLSSDSFDIDRNLPSVCYNHVNDSIHTPNGQRHINPSSNYSESIYINKPRGRRLVLADGSPAYAMDEKGSATQRSRAYWLPIFEGEDQSAGSVSSDLSRFHVHCHRDAMRGPASSNLTNSSYQILLPNRSTPEDNSEGFIRFCGDSAKPALYFPTWTMSCGITPSSRTHHFSRQYGQGQISGPGSCDLPTARCSLAYHDDFNSGEVPTRGIPSIMLDPYSSSAREFIASRQVLFLTSRRLRVNSVKPHVWIVNYYGRNAAQVINSKIVPGSSISLVDTKSSYSNNSLYSSTTSVPSCMTRVLGYLESQDISSHIPKPKLNFLRLIGRGGTSAVYSGVHEDGSDDSNCTPVVAKILNCKHWKCALAELVASAAVIHRMSEADWLISNVSKRHKSKSETSPTADSIDSRHTLDDNCPFVQGGVWLMPTELHLFWDSEGPPSESWIFSNGGSKKVDNLTNQPRFSGNKLPGLCCLVLRDSEDGVPLLTWLNTVFVKKRRKPSHEMCVYFAYTVMTLIRQLHACGLIHGDIKPDNFVLLSSGATYSSKRIFSHVQTNHPMLVEANDPICPVTIAGIDFGRSLDVKECLRDVVFIGDTQVSDFRCPAMLEKSSWETQIDLTGLAVTIYTVISLKYPKIRKKRADAIPDAQLLSVGDARGSVGHSYWFGSRARGDLNQNNFWMGILDRLINFNPSQTTDGHTLLDSCLLLRQLERELLGLFETKRSDLRTNYDTLYAELSDMHDFILDYQKRGATSVMI